MEDFVEADGTDIRRCLYALCFSPAEEYILGRPRVTKFAEYALGTMSSVVRLAVLRGGHRCFFCSATKASVVVLRRRQCPLPQR